MFIAEFVERLPTIFPVNIIYRFSLKAELAIFFPHVLRARRLARPGLEPGSSDSEPSALTTGLLEKAVALVCPRYMKYLLVWNWAPLGKMINFAFFAQRNAMQRSVFRSRRSVIRWIFVQSGFDRSLVWKWICSKGTPQIRNPDPDSPKGTHP